MTECQFLKERLLGQALEIRNGDDVKFVENQGLGL